MLTDSLLEALCAYLHTIQIMIPKSYVLLYNGQVCQFFKLARLWMQEEGPLHWL